MAKLDDIQNESVSKGNSEDSLLVIYVLNILKKYSSPKNFLSSQDVMEYLKADYSIGYDDKAKADALKKKVRRHLDTLYEFYGSGCIKKVEGKTRLGHRWGYDILRDKSAGGEKGAAYETLSKEEIDFIVDIITSSKIINSVSTASIVNKLLKKTDASKEERTKRLSDICREDWGKSLNDDLVSLKNEIDSYIDEWCKIKFDYENTTSVLATPYGWNSDDSGKYILVAKVDGQKKGEFSTFYIEKIQNIKKAEYDYSDYDDTFFDIAYLKPDKMSLESLFSNIRTISHAIEKRDVIEFKYLTYVVRDERVAVVGNNKRVMPHSFVFNDGKYYLIGYDESSAKIEYYRVDLISDLSCSDTKIEISNWNAQILSGIQRAREVEKHPLMISGKDIPVTFNVVESALDRVIDAFGKSAKIEVVNDDSFNEDFSDEKVLKVSVRTTYDEAFRWALANADAVELVSPLDIRQKLRRMARPIYRRYLKTKVDKVCEHADRAYTKGEFRISPDIGEDIAFESFKLIENEEKISAVNEIKIYKSNADLMDYMSSFVNARFLDITQSQCVEPQWVSKLTELVNIHISMTSIEKVSWLRDLKKLKVVRLMESPISDLSVLKDHKNIVLLSLRNLKVRDISYIESQQRLLNLHITGCPVEDYTPLLRIPPLDYLEIDSEAVEAIGMDNLVKHHPDAVIVVKKKINNRKINN